jgi:hypothetical protein
MSPWNPSVYAKALISAAIAFITALGVALNTPGITSTEWSIAIGAFITAFLATYSTTNARSTSDPSTPSISQSEGPVA